MTILRVTNDMEINIISGSVQLSERNSKRKVDFDFALVLGDTEAEIQDNFKWHEVFMGSKYSSERAKAKEMEAKGAVRLLSFKIERTLGRSFITRNESLNLQQ